MAYRIVKSPAQVESQKSPKTSFGLESLYRIPMQAVTGMASQAKGMAGDLMKTINDLVAAPVTEQVFKQTPVPYEETLVGKIIPSTEQIRKKTEKEFSYTKPKNIIEKFTRDLSGDATSLLLTGKTFNMGKYAFSPLRSLSISAAANTVGKGVELWSGDESKGDFAKNGAMLVLSLLNPTSAKNISSNLYTKANELLPTNATVNSQNMLSKLNNLENKILQGRPAENLASSEKFVIDEINKFRNLEKNGQISINSLVAQKRSLSEELSKQLYGLPDRAAKARARELAQDISHTAKDTLRQYGIQNPEWWKLQQAADRAHGSIAQSNYITRILDRFMKGRPEGLAHIFGISGPAIASYFTGMKLGGAIPAAYQATKISHRMIQSPELRKHYIKVISAAAADNPKLIHKELDKMEEQLEKKSKGRYKIINR